MKQMCVGKSCVIIKGRLQGTIGRVVGYDSKTDIVDIEYDPCTTVRVASEHINQGEFVPYTEMMMKRGAES